MNYFRQTPAQRVTGTGSRLLAGYVLVSVGILLAAGGGSWDINNHLLNKPETFFAPPHAVLYSGAATAVAGAVMLLSASKHAGSRMIWPTKLAMAGVIILVVAGPVDFMWHSAYGLDGLLSPPHFVLVSGMIASSVGALAGMVYHKSAASSELRLHPALIVIGMLPVWLAVSGMIDMFSLPFSHTGYFNFDPHPALAVAIATLAFPLLISVLMCTSSALAGRRFGVLTATAAAFMATSMLTSMVPNDALISTIPFYAASIIPFAAADALLSFSRARISQYASGAIVGLTFFMLYYPLITYTYNKVMTDITVWPSLIAPTYFEMIGTVFPLVVAPAIAMGILGAIASNKLVAQNKAL
ncbi:MAG TPA: hypothetical protein VHK86_07710 [Nitrososphaera sp.]|jgi:hypothetical protein|nr:hypothetical protein [Nitrososphaera sp.]HEX2614268.1 hypothetical protein [Nitrososphaera sp.]